MANDTTTQDATAPKRARYVPVQLTDEKRAELEDAYEDIIIMRGDAEKAPWLLVLRRPTRKETIGFKAHAKKDSTTANEELIKRIAVYPKNGEPDYEKQLDRWPLIPDFISQNGGFMQFLGGAVDDDLK